LPAQRAGHLLRLDVQRLAEVFERRLAAPHLAVGLVEADGPVQQRRHLGRVPVVGVGGFLHLLPLVLGRAGQQPALAGELQLPLGGILLALLLGRSAGRVRRLACLHPTEKSSQYVSHVYLPSNRDTG
jgi:hypothetical protein